MAKTRAQKEDIVKNLTQLLKEAKSLVFCDYYGLSVGEMDDLRTRLRKEGVRFLVTRKTLFSRAAKEVDLNVDPKRFEGGLGIAFGLEDEIAPARIIYNFSKEHEALAIQGGALGEEVVDSSYVKMLAVLPSRDELIAKAVGSIAAPLSGLVGVLSGTMRSLVYTLKAIQENKI